MTPVASLKKWCLCGAHFHCVDAPGLLKCAFDFWSRGHRGLGHGECKPGDAKRALRLRSVPRESLDDFRQAMNDLRP